MTAFDRRRLSFLWRYLRGKVPWDSGLVPPEVIDWLRPPSRDNSAGARARPRRWHGTTASLPGAHEWDWSG